MGWRYPAKKGHAKGKRQGRPTRRGCARGRPYKPTKREPPAHPPHPAVQPRGPRPAHCIRPAEPVHRWGLVPRPLGLHLRMRLRLWPGALGGCPSVPVRRRTGVGVRVWLVLGSRLGWSGGLGVGAGEARWTSRWAWQRLWPPGVLQRGTGSPERRARMAGQTSMVRLGRHGGETALAGAVRRAESRVWALGWRLGVLLARAPVASLVV
jgi:hypothetical protein